MIQCKNKQSTQRTLERQARIQTLRHLAAPRPCQCNGKQAMGYHIRACMACLCMVCLILTRYLQICKRTEENKHLARYHYNRQHATSPAPPPVHRRVHRLPSGLQVATIIEVQGAAHGSHGELPVHGHLLAGHIPGPEPGQHQLGAVVARLAVRLRPSGGQASPEGPPPQAVAQDELQVEHGIQQVRAPLWSHQ